MTDHPTGVAVWGSDPAPDCNLTALLSAAWDPPTGLAFREYRSRRDPSRAHECGVRWSEPLATRRVRIRWPAGYAPRSLRVRTVEPAPRVFEAPATAGDATVLELGDRPIRGVTLHQTAGGGHASHPDELRVLCLAVEPARPPDLEVRLRSGDGRLHAPALPFLSREIPLDVSFARAVHLAGAPRSAAAVRLDITRVGAVGAPDCLRAWLAATPGLRVLEAGAWRDIGVHGVHLDTAEAGVAAGVVGATLLLATRVERMEAVEVPLPNARAAFLALCGAHWLPVAPATSRVAPDAPRPLRLAASLGVPGTDERIGVTPDGDLLLRPPDAVTHAACVHACVGLSLGADPPQRLAERPGTRVQRRRIGPALEVSAASPDAIVRWTLRPDGRELRWTLRVHNLAPARRTGLLVVAFARRDGLWPQPLGWDEGPLDRPTPPGWRWRAATTPGGEGRIERALDLAAGASAEATLTLPLASREPRAAALPTPCAFQLPEPWHSHVRALLDQAALFVLGDGTVSYGLFPSVYHGQVFGLEEDYLFYGLAGWGAVEQALDLFRRTYLTDAHLDPEHYLYDLRAGLTLWQAGRLLRLAHGGLDAFDPVEQARLHRLVRWIRDQRRLTATATGLVDPAGGPRVFPGLLAPSRYGGDLGFLTQSLSANAAACAGLAAWAELTGDRALARDAEDFGDALRAALDGVAERIVGCEHPFYPLHTGGGEPGDYHHLMASGVVYPLDVLATDDRRLTAMDAHFERADAFVDGLPRFDEWGAPDRGVDAHYGVGWLLRSLRTGRRDAFDRGVRTWLVRVMDPEVFTFREVSPWPPSRPGWGARGHIPGRSLSRSEPCVGSVGALLQLLRHALVTEARAPRESGAGALLILAGAPEGAWSEPCRLDGVPTACGPATLTAGPLRDGRLEIVVDAPQARGLHICAPRITGHRCLGPAISVFEGGHATLTLAYARRQEDP